MSVQLSAYKKLAYLELFFEKCFPKAQDLRDNFKNEERENGNAGVMQNFGDMMQSLRHFLLVVLVVGNGGGRGSG